MKAAPRWMVNKIVPVPGETKPDHIITYVSGKVRRGKGIHGTPDDVAQWGTYEQAKAWCDSHSDYLPSFALGPDTQGGCWQAIDRDESLAGNDSAPGYVEISRSGNGYHVFGYGESFASLNKDHWEAYSDNKVIAVTENMVNDGPVVDLKPFVERRRKVLGVDAGDTRALLQGYIDGGVIPDGERNNAMTAFVGHAVAAWARGMCSELEALVFLGRLSRLIPKGSAQWDCEGQWRRFTEKEGLTRTLDPRAYVGRDDGGALELFRVRRQEAKIGATGRLIDAPGAFIGEETPDEFVIENFILVGLAVLYGPYGSGKTTAIIALMLHAAGVVTVPGLPPGIPRRVVYVSEFSQQVRSALKGYERAGKLLCSVEEANQRVRLIDADLLEPEVWAAEIELLFAEIATDHSGEEWWPAPLVVFDTGPSNLHQQKLEDNTETYRNLSILGQALAGTSASLWIVLHTAKALKNAAPEVLTALGAQAWGAASIGEVKITREEDALLVSLGRTKFELVEDDEGRAIDQYRVETERLPPVALPTAWGKQFPHLAEQKKTVRIVVSFEPTTSADTRANREEAKDAKRDKATVEKIREAMSNAHKSGKVGICIAAPGSEGGYPEKEIDDYVVVPTRTIFSKRSSVEERAAFFGAEVNAGNCEEKDGYYFFKYRNLYGLG
jgi:hypothetical protein